MSRIEEIRARRAAATPGEWELGDGWVYTSPPNPTDPLVGISRALPFRDTEKRAAERERVQRDCEFIANAPADIDWLLAEVEGLRGDLTDALTRERDGTLLGYAIRDDLAARLAAVEALCETALREATPPPLHRNLATAALRAARGESGE